MRLHRLVISAVGPFAGTVEIDFTRLGDNGLFLLEGPTGSGKSTVLDAISFALFGKVAQAGGDPERLRSHFAHPDTDSFVELSFSTQRGCYRIRRSPRYQRPKKRGDGLRTINPTALLWRVTDPDEPGAGELLSTRLDEVADEITHAVGLNHAQFVQTVILPQGEFANFLRAPTDSKRTLLQRLFGTELLARVQAELIEQRQTAERARHACTQDLTTAVHGFLGAAGVNSTEPFAQALIHPDTDELQLLASAVVADLGARADAAGAATTHADRIRTAVTAQLLGAQDLADRVQTRDALLERRQSLLKAADLEDALAAEIAAAERAAPVTAIAHDYQDACERHATAAALADLRRARLPSQWRDSDELTLRSVADQLRYNRGALDEHEARESELLVLQAQARAIATEQAATQDCVAAEDRQLAGIIEELSDLQAPRDRAAAAWASLESLRTEHLRASEVLTAAISARSILDEVALCEADVLTALDDQRAVGEELHQLRGRRLDSIAGELGLQLKSGEPCRVCGSTVHPRPAQPGFTDVTQEQVRAAERRFDEVSAATERAKEQVHRIRQRSGELHALAAGRSVLAAEAELEDLHRRVESATMAGEEVRAFDLRREALLTSQAEVTERLRTRLSRVDVLADQLHRTQREIVNVELLLRDARAGFATVGERLVDVDGQLVILDDAISHVGVATNTGEALRRARSSLDKALAEAGLDGEDEFTCAYRPAPELQSLRKQLAAIRAEWAYVEQSLAAPTLADPALDATTVGQCHAQIAEHTAAAVSAESIFAQAAAEAGSARDRLAEAAAHRDKISEAIAHGSEIFASTADAVRLGYLVAGLGDNQLRMDLSTYVLIRRFSEILDAANVALRRISNGRYELQHSDAKQGNARSGLGLRVLDLRTDKARDPATLSGGETFYVSLSLALGLADVVRAESGGIDLGMLFIDEGFGSLDSEVLDEVLSVLDGLRAGGRAVGVVSHVAELKARISDRIEIRAGPDGSSRLSVVA